MCIASNKPSDEMLKAVPHHMIDIVSVEDEYNVGIFNEQATAIIEDIIDRGKTPIVVGGSGMYMQVLLDGIFEGPGEDAALRQEFDIIAEKDGIEALHQRLIPSLRKRFIKMINVVLYVGWKFLS